MHNFTTAYSDYIKLSYIKLELQTVAIFMPSRNAERSVMCCLTDHFGDCVHSSLWKMLIMKKHYAYELNNFLVTLQLEVEPKLYMI
jgi:hypothetical protein